MPRRCLALAGPGTIAPRDRHARRERLARKRHGPVERARRVDADTGGFEFVLPTAAPGLAAYDAGRTTAVTFATQAASAGQYTLEALVSGKPTQTETMDLSTGDKTKAFVFAP